MSIELALDHDWNKEQYLPATTRRYRLSGHDFRDQTYNDYYQVHKYKSTNVSCMLLGQN